MNQQAHYSSTSEMLRAFFAKPLTLVLAITFALSALAQTLVPVIAGQGFKCDLFSICFAIGFFMLYFKAHSQDPYPNYKAPLTLIKVTSIILTSLVGVAFVFLLICIPMLSSLESIMPSFVSTFKILFIVFAALLIVFFVYNLGFTLLVGSMKKTFKTNTVKRTGAALTGVSGIIFLLSCVGYIFVILLMAELIVSAFTEVFSLLLEESLYSTGSDITFTSLANTSNTVESSSSILDFSSLITPIISFVNIIISSIYALCYNSFMKKAEKNFVPTAPVSSASSVGSASSFGVSPRPTYPGQSYSAPTQNYGGPARSNYGGSAVPATMNYSRALAPEIHFGDEFNANEDRRICPTCGSKVELSLDFCPQCGFKFIVKDETPVEKDPEPTPVEPVVEPVVPAPTPVVEPFAPAPAPVAEPVAPAQTPVAEPFAPAQAPVVEPVAPAPAPVVEPVAPAPAPVAEPIAPAQAPVVEPVAPAQTPVVEPVAPAPFNQTAPVEQPFVAPFQTIDTAFNQPSVSEQPLVTPFFNSNMQPSRSKSKPNDDDAKPMITNSNLRR